MQVCVAGMESQLGLRGAEGLSSEETPLPEPTGSWEI